MQDRRSNEISRRRQFAFKHNADLYEEITEAHFIPFEEWRRIGWVAYETTYGDGDAQLIIETKEHEGRARIIIDSKMDIRTIAWMLNQIVDHEDA